jgi:L-lactate dehydrogenase complex protein LldE
MNVSLFVTCLTDLFAPQVGMAVVRVLEHFGCTVDFPQDQTCCGQPQFNNGYHAEARMLACRLIEVFQGSTYVVTPSASCAAMVREHYVEVMKGDPIWEEKARLLAAKTYEFTEFLRKVLNADLSTLSLPRLTSIATHYTCHNRGIGQSLADCTNPLTQLGNARVIPLEKAEQCCGFGGTFAVKFPEVSAVLVEEKVASAVQANPDVLLVNDAGCAMNISGACHRRGKDIPIRHVAELLACAIDARTSRAPSPTGGAR